MIGRHLAEGLLAEIVGGALAGADQPGAIIEPDFLQRPAHANVAHMALGKGRHPFIANDLDRGIVSLWHCILLIYWDGSTNSAGLKPTKITSHHRLIIVTLNLFQGPASVLSIGLRAGC